MKDLIFEVEPCIRAKLIIKKTKTKPYMNLTFPPTAVPATTIEQRVLVGQSENHVAATRKG